MVYLWRDTVGTVCVRMLYTVARSLFKSSLNPETGPAEIRLGVETLPSLPL